MKPLWALSLSLLSALAAAGGGCSWMRQSRTPPPPVAIQGQPTAEQVVRAVNATAASVRQLQTDNATLSLPGLPKLRTDIAVERPRRMRLRCNFIGMGQILDLGSNDQLLWAMIDAPQLPGAPPRGVYYVRHEQFQSSAAREALPVPPQALIEAFGLVELHPQAIIEGPYARGPGQLEFRARIPSYDGGATGTKIVVVDDRYGWILEQHWYDIAGQWTGSVISSNHRFDPQSQASLPHRLEVRLPPPRVSFEIAVDSYRVNQLPASPGQLWNMPVYEGYPLVDLAAPPPAAVAPAGPGTPPSYPPAYPSARRPLLPASAVYPEARYRPPYRGYSDRR